jgi:DNA-directed RNA polymerase subunit RPC12/RpoP
MEVAEKCSKCNAAFGKLDAQVCSRCGWDSQVGMRKCVKCKNAVALVERPGYGPMGGLAGLGGFIFWFLFGLLLGGAIASVIAAVCALITIFTLKYACSDCGKIPESRLLDAEEKEVLKKRRLGFLIGAVGFGVLAVVLLGARLLLFVHGMNSATSGS